MLSCIVAAGFSASMMMAIVSTVGVISVSVLSLFWQTFQGIVYAPRRKRYMKGMIVFMLIAIPTVNIIVVLFTASRATMEADLKTADESIARFVVVGGGICATFGFILGSIGLTGTHLCATSIGHLFLGGVAASITGIRCEREKLLLNLFMTTVFIPHALGVLTGQWGASAATARTLDAAFVPVSPPCAPPGEDPPDETTSLSLGLPHQQPLHEHLPPHYAHSTGGIWTLPSQPGILQHSLPVSSAGIVHCTHSFAPIAQSKAPQHNPGTKRPGTDDTDDSSTSLSSQDSSSAQAVRRLVRKSVPDTSSYPVLVSGANEFATPPVDTAAGLADSVFCNQKMLIRMASKGIQRVASQWCTRRGDNADSIMVFLATHIYNGDFGKVKDLIHSHTLLWGLYAISSDTRCAFLVAAAAVDIRLTECQRVVLNLSLVSTHVDWRRVGIADTLIIRVLPELISDGWIYAESNDNPFWESLPLVVSREAISIHDQLHKMHCNLKNHAVPRTHRVSKGAKCADDALVRCLEEEGLVDVLMRDASNSSTMCTTAAHTHTNDEVPKDRVALDFDVRGSNASRTLTLLYDDATRSFTTVDGCYYASLDEGTNGGSAIGLYENAETVIRGRHPFESVKLRAIRR